MNAIISRAHANGWRFSHSAWFGSFRGKVAQSFTRRPAVSRVHDQAMLRFIRLRVLQSILALYIIITATFFLLRFVPGGPFTAERAVPKEILRNLEAHYGLNQPLYRQYFSYLGTCALLGIIRRVTGSPSDTAPPPIGATSNISGPPMTVWESAGQARLAPGQPPADSRLRCRSRNCGARACWVRVSVVAVSANPAGPRGSMLGSEIQIHQQEQHDLGSNHTGDHEDHRRTVLPRLGGAEVKVALGQLHGLVVVELLLHLSGAGVTLVGISFQRMKDDLLDDRSQLFVDLARRDRVAGDAGVHDDVRTLAFEERGTGRHLIQDGAEAVDVGAVVAAAAFHLLGGHIVRGAHRRSETGEREAARKIDAGDAEVEKPQTAVAADHYVLWL